MHILDTLHCNICLRWQRAMRAVCVCVCAHCWTLHPNAPLWFMKHHNYLITRSFVASLAQYHIKFIFAVSKKRIVARQICNSYSMWICRYSFDAPNETGNSIAHANTISIRLFWKMHEIMCALWMDGMKNAVFATKESYIKSEIGDRRALIQCECVG